jgi:hypothetical protein
MSTRGLLVALLCGVLGLAGGAVVAYVAQPHTSYGNDATPLLGVSPSVPIDEPSKSSYRPDIDYPPLSPDLALPPPVHTIGNDLATWTYHVPQGWQAYAVCSTVGECTPPMTTDTRLTPEQADRQPEVRFRPPDEPTVGGYSLRVKILDNTLGLNPGQLVSTKIKGFEQTYDEFDAFKQSPSAVYFTYRDGNNHLRYNFFQWFAAPGSSTATLEMSVAGRKRDVSGLKALFNRFADNVSGSDTPYHPPTRHPASTGGTPGAGGSPSR